MFWFNVLCYDLINCNQKQTDRDQSVDNEDIIILFRSTLILGRRRKKIEKIHGEEPLA